MIFYGDSRTAKYTVLPMFLFLLAWGSIDWLLFGNDPFAPRSKKIRAVNIRTEGVSLDWQKGIPDGFAEVACPAQQKCLEFRPEEKSVRRMRLIYRNKELQEIQYNIQIDKNVDVRRINAVFALHQ